MIVARVSILLVCLLSAGIILLQNRLPAITLSFLGFQSQSLALGFWILIAVGLGLLTGSLLMQLMGASAGAPRPRAKGQGASRFTQGFTAQRSPRKKSKAGDRWVAPPPDHPISDWYSPPATDWTARPSAEGYVSHDAAETEPFRPEAGYDNDSLDELFDADFDPDADGREPERVVDADYRVISPPLRPPPAPDDWEDDFFKEDD